MKGRQRQRQAALPAQLRSFEIGSLVSKAEHAFAAGDYAGAVRGCQEALRRDPSQARALRLLGTMAQATGANEVAIGFFTRAIAADKRLVAAHLGLGDAHMAARQIKQAVAAYGRAVALAPKSAEAQVQLGNAFIALGERDRALESFRRAILIDPGHRLAAYMASGLAGEASPAQADYVRGVFDDYADHFDEHLVSTLGYRMPRLIADVLAAVQPDPFAAALDLGCGTGLVADALGESGARVIDGVDISPRMLEVARRRERYRALHEAELVEFLGRPATAAMGYDLVVAADVFIYIGRLEAVFAGIAAILPPGGLLAFSVEHAEGEDCLLQASGRYAHGELYIARLAAACGFERLQCRLVPLRRENNTDIGGRLELLRRNEGDFAAAP